VFDTADSQPGRTRSIKSLSYCKEEVEAQFAEWSAMQAGKSGDTDAPPKEGAFTPIAIAEHVASCLDKIDGLRGSAEPGLLEAFDRAREVVSALGEFSESSEKIEANLGAADAIIDEALLASSSSSAAKEGVLLKMASYKETMDRESYERTMRLMLVKKIREELGVPRFSLFYL